MRENLEGIKVRGNGYTSHICEQCSAEFIGRRNAKFCSLPCKNTFNNDRVRGRDGVLRKYYRVIERNYKILTEWLESGKVEISHIELLRMGYKTDFFTARPSYVGNNKSLLCFACCDLVLIPLTETNYKIQKDDRL